MASACHACSAQIIFVRTAGATIACSVPADPTGPLAAVKRAFGWTGWWVTEARPANGAGRYTPHAKTCKPTAPRRTVADHRRQQVSAPALPL